MSWGIPGGTPGGTPGETPGETPRETPGRTPYGTFSKVYKTRLNWTSWTGVNVLVNFGKNDFFPKIFIILNFIGHKSQTLKKEVKPYFGDEEEIPHGCEFVQLPHPSGQGMNVGNPMSKSFLDMLQTGVLTSYSASGLDDQNDTAK